MVIGLSPSIIVKGDNFIVSDFAPIGIQTQCIENSGANSVGGISPRLNQR
jgi:hypothetical protein